MFRSSFIFSMFIIYVRQLDGKLPDFIKPCHVSDSELGKCILERAEESLPYVFKGVPELNVPPFESVKLPLLRTPSNYSFVFSFDGSLEGIPNLDYKSIKFDNVTRKGSVQAIFFRLKLTGKYFINGTILDKQVNGRGLATMIFYNVAYDYEYCIPKYDRNGTIYYKLDELVLTEYKAEGAKYQFSNLSGDEEEINDFLNYNWEILHKALGGVLAKNVLKLVGEVVNKFFASAPAREIFIPPEN